MNKTIGIILIVLLILGGVAGVLLLSKETEKNIHLFYTEDEKQCKRINSFLDELLFENENITIHRYDVWNNEEDKELMEQFIEQNNIEKVGIPMIVVGDRVLVGYISDTVSGEKIDEMLNDCTSGCREYILDIKVKDVQYEPTYAPIEKPDDINSDLDVC